MTVGFDTVRSETQYLQLSLSSHADQILGYGDCAELFAEQSGARKVLLGSYDAFQCHYAEVATCYVS
jgi:hypothetical protein